MRRVQTFLVLLSCLLGSLALPTAHAQEVDTRLTLVGYQQFALRVTDLERSVAFYSAVFGLSPVRIEEAAVFQLEEGDQYFSLRPASKDEAVGIAWIGLGIENFDVARLAAAFERLGFERSAAPTPRSQGLEHASRFWQTEILGEDAFFFADAEGVRFRLMPTEHCAVCAGNEASGAAGLLSARGINHFTNFVANSARGNALFRQAFGLEYLSYQGPNAPTLSLGDGRQFLMYFGGDAQGAPSSAGRTDHVSLSLDEFDVDALRSRLTAYGLVATGGQRPPQPLTHWVSLRMPNRGGAQGGTPELYFADPDGIAIQVQAASYCGGDGYFGDECPAL